MAENTKKSWLEKIEKVGDVPTPFIVTDLNIVEGKVRELKSLLDNVEIYYAIKSNAQPEIISHIDKMVDGYDVASLGEWQQLEKQGISPQRVLFSNPVKIDWDIQTAYKDGLRYYALDSVDEVKKLGELAPDAKVYIRVQVSDYGSRFPLSKKYGLRPSHVLEYADLAKSVGLQVCGLTFHVGSQAENIQIWNEAFEICGDLIAKLRLRGMDIDLLNMGGGFPADYGQPIPSTGTMCRQINKAIKKYIPSGVRIVAEPGRFIVANSSVLVTEVIAREHRSGTDWLHLDMGVFQGLMEPLEMKGWKYPTFTTRNPRGYKKDFVLTGPSCDPYDTIGMDYLLPSDIARGDKIYFQSVGAYSTVYGSNFNGFSVPKTYFVK